jgi:hypothetical protein
MDPHELWRCMRARYCSEMLVADGLVSEDEFDPKTGLLAPDIAAAIDELLVRVFLALQLYITVRRVYIPISSTFTTLLKRRSLSLPVPPVPLQPSKCT